MALLASVACAKSDDALVVTIEARPAVRDDLIAALELTLGNDGQQVTETLTAASEPYPATFSISHPGRAGALTVDVRALDASGAEVARGSSTFDLAAASPTVWLTPGDFVANSIESGDQELATTAANSAQQLAAAGSRFVLSYRDACTLDACTVRGRVFDHRGRAISTELAAGPGSFEWPSQPFQADAASEVAVAALSDGAVVGVWRGATQLRCRALAADGATRSDTVMLLGAPTAEAISVHALADDDVLITWIEPIDAFTAQLMTAVVDPTCRLVRSAAAAGPTALFRPTVVVTPDASLFVFLSGGALIGLRGDARGQPDPSGTTLSLFVPPTTMESIHQWRVAATPDGYALLVGTALRMSSRGPLRLVRLDHALAVVGAPTLLGTGDHTKTFPPDLVARHDGALAVAWLSQAEPVVGLALQVVRPTGLPVGAPIAVASSAASAAAAHPQVAALDDAFVVAWTASGGDAEGKAVRARVLYPPYDDATGMLGAACDVSGPRGCDEATACAADADLVPRCLPRCDPSTTGDPCPGGGTCVDVTGTTVCTLQR